MENFIMQFELDSIDAKICDDIIQYHIMCCGQGKVVATTHEHVWEIHYF